MLFNLLLQCAADGEPGGVGRSWSVSLPPKTNFRIYDLHIVALISHVYPDGNHILPAPPWDGWWPGDIWCLLCWGDPISMFSWAGDTNEPPVTEGWCTGEEPLLLPPIIEWRPANFGDGIGDCGTWPIPSELLLLDRGSWIPEPATELDPLLMVEPVLPTDGVPLNCRRLFADVPRTTPDNVSISFLLGHGL